MPTFATIFEAWRSLALILLMCLSTGFTIYIIIHLAVGILKVFRKK